MTDKEKKEKLDIIVADMQVREKRGEKLRQVWGAFGEQGLDTTGYVEKAFMSPHGGLMIKFYGCTQLWKGFPEREALTLLGLAKRFFDISTREIMSGGLFSKIVIGFMLLFKRKTVIHIIRTALTHVDSVITRKVVATNPKTYCKTSSAIRITTREVFRKLWDLDVDSKSVLYEETDYVGKRELMIAIACACELFYHVLEYDNAYRFRFQDVFQEVDKEKLEQDPQKEIERLFSILLTRENTERMASKWRILRKIIRLIFRFQIFKECKDIKKFIIYFMMELPRNVISMDESDRYYSADRNSYEHEGKPQAERLRWRQTIDDRDGNIRLIPKVIQVPEKQPEKTK